jgi:hypothetical protein
MSSDSSLQKAAASSEVIDVDRDEPKIKIENAGSFSARETEDELEDDKNQNPNNGNEVKSQESSKATSGQDNENDAGDSSDGNSTENNSMTPNGKYTKLEEVQKFDILLPKESITSEVGQTKKDLYTGFISYRKLIGRIKPVYMERDTSEHKTKIGKWMIARVEERGGRFLKELGDGTSGNCKVMTAEESLDITINSFEDNIQWTDIARSIHGNKEGSKQLAQGSNVDNISHEQIMQLTAQPTIPQSRMMAAELQQPDMSSSTGKIAEPPLKKIKTGVAGAMFPGPPSSLNLPLELNVSEKDLAHNDTQKAQFLLQNCLRERQMIRAELTENQEILLMRQERLSRLEAEFRVFQDRQIFLTSERFLTEKILRQEEIFENRELLGIQHQRCRRLQTILELNERQMYEQVEQQTKLGREKLKLDSKRNASQEEKSSEIPTRENVMDQIFAGQDAHQKKVLMNQLIQGDNSTRALMEAEMREQQLATQQVIDHHVALEVEMNRRAVLEQRAAMEQELKYRQTMEHAVNRQAAMQQAMEARQLMMAQSGISQPHEVQPSEVQPSDVTLQETSKKSSATEVAIPDVKQSMGDADSTRNEADIIHDKEAISIQSDGGDNDGEGEEEADEDDDEDDDFIVI